MNDSYKATIELAKVEPSKENPRVDFGDIDALADAIRATGGQPVNPIVVVHDGDIYRIVDGERRYRAMLEVAGEDGHVDALVYDDYSAAHTAVAMLATDDKQQLTDVERAHGFQTMLALGVEEKTMARAVRRSVGDIRKARSVAAEAPEQATLDQMILAADMEGEWRERMLAASAPTPAVARSIADQLAREMKREKSWQDVLAVLDEYGVPLLDGGRPPKGTISKYCYDSEDARGFLATLDADQLASTLVAMRVSDYSAAVYVWYTPTATDVPEETDEERESRLAEERRDAVYKRFRVELAEEYCTIDFEDASSPLLTAAGVLFREKQAKYDVDNLASIAKRRKIDLDAFKTCVAHSPMSNYELIELLLNTTSRIEWYELVAELMPLANDEGMFFNSDEDFVWLLDLAEQKRREAQETTDVDDDLD